MKQVSFKRFFPNPYLLIAIIVAAFLRLFLLDRIPMGISGDELTYLFTAKIVHLTGHDITQMWNPLSAFIFQYPPHQLPQAELPYFLTPFLWLPLPFSLFFSRLPGALLSIGIVILMYGVVKRVCNENTAIAVAFLTAINPWMIFTGRTFFEVVPATFFFLGGFYVLLVVKKNYILLAIPVFFLAFYSYIGTKLIFLPFVFITLLFVYQRSRKFFLQYAVVFLCCVFLTAFFVLNLKLHAGNSRLSEVLLPNNPAIAGIVDESRKTTMDSPLAQLYENKATVFGSIVTTKFFNTISPSYLFLTGDSFFPIWQHGFFYILDALFLLLGIASIFKKHKDVGIVSLSLIILGTIPQILHASGAGGLDLGNMSPHVVLIFPFVLLLTAYGIAQAIELFKKAVYKRLLIGSILFLYAFSLFNFINVYFFIFPLQNYYDQPVRILSHYLQAAPKSRHITVFSSRSGDLFKKYLFYGNVVNSQTISHIESEFSSNGPWEINNISFVGCNRNIDPSKTDDVLITDGICGSLTHNNVPSVALSQLVDGGITYEIFHDDTCSNAQLPGYPSHITIEKLLLENLTKKEFCQTYLRTL